MCLYAPSFSAGITETGYPYNVNFIAGDYVKKADNKQQRRQATSKMLDIESKNRLSSTSIDELSNNPFLLECYLKTSIENTFSELLFRLTHEKYQEKKAQEFWKEILKHRDKLNKDLKRDVGILVATLDYLTNILEIIPNPKIIDDKSLEQTVESGTRDTLTGLYLRRVFDFYLEREIIKASRYSEPLSLIMLDIDNFKSVNDNYGHQTGDKILKQVGRIVLKTCRQTDLAARYGGEEISVVLPATPMEEAFVLAERLRKEIYDFYHSKQPTVSVSIGISSFNQQTNSSTNLIGEADKALYQAKSSGKNRVVKYY